MNNEIKVDGVKCTTDTKQDIMIDSASYYPKPYKKMATSYRVEAVRGDHSINLKKWLVVGCILISGYYFFR